MISTREKSVPIVYIPSLTNKVDIKVINSKFWMGNRIIIKSKDIFVNTYVCWYTGNDEFRIEPIQIDYIFSWSIGISASYDYSEDDFGWLTFEGKNEKNFLFKPTKKIYVTCRIINGMDLYIIGWDHCEELSVPDKLEDFINKGDKNMTVSFRKVCDPDNIPPKEDQFDRNAMEDLPFEVDQDFRKEPNLNIYATSNGLEVSANWADYISLYTTDTRHPVILQSHSCSLYADRSRDRISNNTIYVKDKNKMIMLNQETKHDKIFVKAIRDSNILCLIFSAYPGQFITPQIEGYIDTRNPTIDLEILESAYNSIVCVDSGVKKLKYQIVDDNIEKIKFKISDKKKKMRVGTTHSNITLSVKRSDEDNKCILYINSCLCSPSEIKYKLDENTTNVIVWVERGKKGHSLKFTITKRMN